MNAGQFKASLADAAPPQDLAAPLAALWWDAKGDWARAHESAQQDEGVEGSWVHAYLHRKEGDQGNATYWYGRAGKPVCRQPLDAEWGSIVRGFDQSDLASPFQKRDIQSKETLSGRISVMV